MLNREKGIFSNKSVKPLKHNLFHLDPSRHQIHNHASLLTNKSLDTKFGRAGICISESKLTEGIEDR